MRKFDLSYLENSEIYEVNRLESKSDHKFYRNLDELLEDNSSFKIELTKPLSKSSIEYKVVLSMFITFYVSILT